MQYFDASTRADEVVPVDLIAAVVDRLMPHVDGLVLIGAVARDLLGAIAGDFPVQRATHDLDVAVAVRTMGQYRTASATIDPTGREPHFQLGGTQVDIVPFGAVATDSHVLFDNDFRLDVTGLADALASPVTVQLRPEVVVPVASLAAQSVLKLLAWRDRRFDTHARDAVDLGVLLEASSSGEYADEVWADEHALAACDFDFFSAGAFRLGRQARAGMSDSTLQAVVDLTADESSMWSLVRDVGGIRSLRANMLAAYRRGLAAS